MHTSFRKLPPYRQKNNIFLFIFLSNFFAKPPKSRFHTAPEMNQAKKRHKAVSPYRTTVQDISHTFIKKRSSSIIIDLSEVGFGLVLVEEGEHERLHVLVLLGERDFPAGVRPRQDLLNLLGGHAILKEAANRKYRKTHAF